MDTFATLGIVIQTISIIIPILFIINELRLSRRDKLYTNFMELEKEIDDDIMEIWGIPKDKKIKLNDRIIEIELKKLNHMVRLLDTFSLARGQRFIYNKRPFSKESVIYKMFQNNIYRDYWKYIVRELFYGESKRYKFVIDRTIDVIKKNNNK